MLNRLFTFLATFLIAVIPAAATATCTFTQTGMSSGSAVCTTGTETPSGANAGWNFSPGVCPTGVTIFVCTQNASALPSAGSMKYYFYNAARGVWAESPNLAESTSSGTQCQALSGVWTVTNGSRFAVLPNAVGTAVWVDMVCR